MQITRRYWKFLKDLIVVITVVLKMNASSRFIEGGERRFVWTAGGEESEALPVQLEGDYNLDNITTAIAVGLHFNVNRELIGQAISNYTPSNNRSQTTTTGRNTVLLDAYNANPSSMSKALNSFAKNIKGDKLVILGDMRIRRFA